MWVGLFCSSDEAFQETDIRRTIRFCAFKKFTIVIREQFLALSVG